MQVLVLDIAPPAEAHGLDGLLPASHHRGVAVLAVDTKMADVS